MSLLKRSFGECTWTPNGTLAVASTKFTLKLSKTGSSITVLFPEKLDAKTGTTSTFIALSKTLPVWARPSVALCFYIAAKDAGTIGTTPGYLEIAVDGTVKIYPTNAKGAWTDSATSNSGMSAKAVTYIV